MSDRYFANNHHSDLPALTTQEAYSELLQSLDRILHDYPATSSSWRPTFSGFYAGPTSISFLFFSLSNLFPDLIIQTKSLRQWSEAYLRISLSFRHREPDPNNCGIANEKLCSLALLAVLDNDESAVQELCNHVSNLLAHEGQRSFEWLYGLSGLLYLLRLCLSLLPQTSTLVEPAIHETISCIINQPQPWKWHGKEYLGAVHGTIGICTQIVLSSPFPEHLQKLSHILQNLLETQLPSGNFPSSRDSSHKDILVQFCHGAPGFIISFYSLLPHFPELTKPLQSAIQKAEKCVLERGILTKNPCLCHGVYGNALALGEVDMSKFLKLCCEGGLTWDGNEDDENFGLFTGQAGRSWAMAIAAKRMKGIMLGYNDL